jgi:hypothetical protein
MCVEGGGGVHSHCVYTYDSKAFRLILCLMSGVQLCWTSQLRSEETMSSGTSGDGPSTALSAPGL